MSYLAHSKRARIDSFDNNVSHSSSLIDHKEKLFLHINSLYLNNDCSDVEFVFGPDVIPGHKQVLCVNSRWRQLLSEKSSIDMEDVAMTPFKELLRYLYTGKVSLEDYEPVMITELRQLAEKYEMWDLVHPLTDMENIKMSAESVLTLLTESGLESPTGKSCLEFIAHNTQDVLYQDEFYDLPTDYVYAILTRNDLSVSEHVVFEAVKRFLNGSSSTKVDKKRIISAVRLALLPFDYIWINVRKFCDETSLLTIEDLSTISSVKAKLTKSNPEIRLRSFCLPGEDVIAIRSKNALSSRVIRGKVGDLGEENAVFELDLGLHYFLNGIAIIFSASTKARFAFKCETCVDGNDWHLLYDFTKYHTSNRVDLNFEGRVIRYIRLTEGVCYPDWSEDSKKKKDSKPVLKIANIIGLYEEPNGVVLMREHLLASKYLFSQMTCDFTYKSWYKKNGKNFYVCQLNDPIVAVLQQPVWMDSIHLHIPEEEDREYNFIVEVTHSPNSTFKGRDKWQLVGNYKNESRKGDVEVCFEPTIVNVFRVTGLKIVNGKGKEKDFAVEIRI